MLEWMGEVACRPVAQAAVASASVVNFASAVVAFVFGAQINDGLFTGLVLLILSTGVGLVSWCLLAVVRLSAVVSRLEANQAENLRRLERLEDE